METERCPWCLGDDTYVHYHDEEWAVPVHDDNRHFEFIVLEGAQAGLSWLTILKRREGYRRAFAAFDPAAVALFDGPAEERLRSDPGIIRNRLKIHSAITNARAFLNIQAEFGSFDRYIWRFVDGAPIRNHFQTLDQVPAETDVSRKLSRDLKQRGFSFVGPTIVYAHMQATGLVNDHLVGCFRHAQLAHSR